MIIKKPKRYYHKSRIKYFQGGVYVNFNDINPNEFWFNETYDYNGNKIYAENSLGFWVKREYDNNNNIIYIENSDGEILDYR